MQPTGVGRGNAVDLLHGREVLEDEVGGQRGAEVDVLAVDPDLRSAAAVLGASPARVWWEVDARLAARPVLAGAGFAFAVSLGEFGATSFLTRRGSVTVPIEITAALARPGELSVLRGTALASLLLFVTAFVVWLVDRVRPEDGAW